MGHMALGCSSSVEPQQRTLPKLSRIQITESGRLLLLLSLRLSSTGGGNGVSRNGAGVGGPIQAFSYDRSSELWIKVSDSRFVLSDFYSSLPAFGKSKSKSGELSRLDSMVSMGALESSLKPSQRGLGRNNAREIYN